MGTFIDEADARRVAEAAKDPEKMPHGLVLPTKEILEQVARDKIQYHPYLNEEAERRQLEFLTLLYYFEGITIAYRSTTQGPEVLAVGAEEIGKALRGMSQEDLLQIRVGQP